VFAAEGGTRSRQPQWLSGHRQQAALQRDAWQNEAGHGSKFSRLFGPLQPCGPPAAPHSRNAVPVEWQVMHARVPRPFLGQQRLHLGLEASKSRLVVGLEKNAQKEEQPHGGVV